MLNTIVRTGEVLELFTRNRPEWGVTEIAQALDVPKSNAHEILSSLASIDLLRRTGRSRYRLGWRIMLMAGDLVDASSLRRHAPTFMTMLTQVTRETSHLAVWDGRSLVFISRVLSDRGLHQPHAEAGSALPAQCTASGKVLLADLPWEDVVTRVTRSGGMTPRTANSITQLSDLQAQLDVVRDTGIAHNNQEADAGVVGIAAPIRDADGHAIAALGVSMPVERSERFQQTHQKLLRRMAKDLSERVAADVRERRLMGDPIAQIGA